jgi:hypothetical protein
MVRSKRLAGIAAICGAVGVAGAGCNTTEESHGFVCPSLPPASYTMALTYDGESTFDGGCPSTRPLDGQSVTLTLDGQGGATLTEATQTLACWSFLPDNCGLVVECSVPPSDQVEFHFIVGGTALDAGLLVSVDYLVDVSGPEGDETAACSQAYLAE